MSFLLPLVFALHLACVNVAAAGPLVAAWFDAWEGRGNTLAGEAGRFLARWSLWLFLPGMFFGLVLGWSLWTPDYHALIVRLWHKVSWGIAELAVSLVLMAVWLVWWQRRPACRWPERTFRIVVALFASTNLLYHFPVLLAIVEQLSTSDQSHGPAISNAEFRQFLAQPQILARVAHFTLAAIASCGVMLLGFALKLEQSPAHREQSSSVAMWGARIALAPSLLQIPIGMWLTLSLSPTQQNLVMGGDTLTCSLFLLSIAGALALMQTLAALAIGDVSRNRIYRALALIAIVIALMSGVLHRLRAAEFRSLSREA